MFPIIGEGNRKESLQQESTRCGLANVLFKPTQPSAQLKYSVTLPDVHLVSLKPALEGLIVPSKFYSAIAATRPVIFVGDGSNDGDGEIAREVSRGQCGVTVAPDDAVGLANAVERLSGDRDACARMAVMDTNARGRCLRRSSRGRWR